ncbi:hypothetical protein H0H92_010366 [Tricholoma furcatifolium]|nr:hypothetical protein H0H92_010366 [Tricholoma furcatifolium]
MSKAHDSAPTTSHVSNLLALITNSTKIIESHYAKVAPVASLDDLSPHPLDGNFLALPELRNALQILEGACAQLCVTLAPPNHTLINRSMQISDHSCLGVAVAFKIPDVLLEQPSGMHITEIGEKAGVNPQKLGRTLRQLASNHIFREEFLADPEWADSVDSARSPWNRLTGYKEPLFAHYATPEGARYGTMFGVGMGGWNIAVQASVALVDFPWDKYPPGTTVCDLGGGIGNVALQLVKAHPNLQLKLQDLPAVIEEAKTNFWPQECPAAITAKRIEFKALDFLVDLPLACDLYYLKNVIHDWADGEATKILQNIRSAMKPDARVLIHEYVLQPAHHSGDAALKEAPEPMLPNFGVGRIRQYNLDIFMMSFFNSMVRTLDDFIRVAEKADLEFVKLWPTGETSIVEFRPC